MSKSQGNDGIENTLKFDAEGVPDTLFGKFHILKNKIAQDSVGMSLDNLTQAVSVAQIGFYTWDLTQNRVTYSEQMRKDWGIEASTTFEEAINHIHPGDRDVTQRLISQAIDLHTPFRAEYRVVHPDGKIVWILAQGEVQYDDCGKPIRFFGTSMDITERVEARLRLEEKTRELATEQQKLKTMVAESPAAIGLMRGPNYIFEIANPKWCELVSEREYIGRPYSDIYPELVDTPAFQSIKDTYTTGKPFTAHEMKLLVRSRSGQLEDQYFDYTNFRILDGEGAPYGVFCHALNVTERVVSRLSIEENAKNLASTVDTLREERDLRERFVAALTHDLRTPLTSAKLNADLLERKSADPESVKAISRRISNGLIRADKMIRDLLDANRIKAGEGLPISIGECHLDQLVFSSVNELASIQNRHIEVKNANGSIPGYWDGEGILRILENLLGNAIKYGYDKTAITISLLKNDPWVEITVNNLGNVIAPEDLEILFDPYRRTQSALGSVQKGWGLGLTLVKGITAAHGGTVRVESNKENGTTFFVKLPIDSRLHH